MPQISPTGFLLIAFLSFNLLAQDNPPKDLNAPSRSSFSIELSASSSGDGEGMVFGFSSSPLGQLPGLPGGSVESGLMNLLHNKSIREEIELVDEQYQKMQNFYGKRQGEIMKEINTFLSPALSADTPKANSTVKLRGKKLQEIMQKQQQESEAKLKELLLPHQLQRLEQVAHQVRMKNAGTVNALTRGKLKEELGLSPQDIQKLKKKSAKIQEKLQEDIADLQARAKKELLDELSPQQRRKLDELLGQEFQYRQPSWRSRVKKPQENPGAAKK